MTARDLNPDPQTLDAFRGDGVYLGADHRRNERRTWIVAGVCAVSLVAQLAGGLLFHSMALTASGLHMAAHLAAMLAAAAAYAFARRLAHHPRFSFGTGKLGYLAGFANAILLALTAVVIAVESVTRMVAPEAVEYASALQLGALGLVVNLICMTLLRPRREPPQAYDIDGDLNLSAAHLHLAADVAVSVLALAGLFAGQHLGWTWTDPAAGLVGAALVARFALRLLKQAGAALLDVNPSAELTARVRERLQAEGEEIIDLHLWRLGPGHFAAVAVLAADHPGPPQAYHARLAGLAGLSHVTVEVRAKGAAGHGHVH